MRRPRAAPPASAHLRRGQRRAKHQRTAGQSPRSPGTPALPGSGARRVSRGASPAAAPGTAGNRLGRARREKDPSAPAGLGERIPSGSGPSAGSGRRAGRGEGRKVRGRKSLLFFVFFWFFNPRMMPSAYVTQRQERPGAREGSRVRGPPAPGAASLGT